MHEPYHYARLEGGMRRYLLYAELRSALYCALVDLATAHQALLAAQDHWPLLQALKAIAAGRLAAG